MERFERIGFAVLVLGVFVLIVVQLRRASTPVVVAAPGTPPQAIDAQQADNNDVGLWRIYYNTPGVYNLTPAIIPTVMAPALVSPSQPANANPQMTGTGECSSC